MLWPTPNAGICQGPFGRLYTVPAAGTAATSKSPTGSSSSTRSVVAASGPWFVAVTVNVTVVPTRGAALSTLLATAMSAARTVITALAWLLVASGSVWFPTRPEAVFVMVPTCEHAGVEEQRRPRPGPQGTNGPHARPVVVCRPQARDRTDERQTRWECVGQAHPRRVRGAKVGDGHGVPHRRLEDRGRGYPPPS